MYFGYIICLNNKCTRAPSALVQCSINKSILLLIIPISGSRLDFTCGFKFPPEDQLYPLKQVAGNFDMADISQMVFGVDVVVR